MDRRRPRPDRTAGQAGQPHHPGNGHDPAVRGEFAFELGQPERVGIRPRSGPTLWMPRMVGRNW